MVATYISVYHPTHADSYYVSMFFTRIQLTNNKNVMTVYKLPTNKPIKHTVPYTIFFIEKSAT